MLTKQFYISITIGDLEDTAVIGTAKFEQYVRTYILNTTLLSESELELFKGTLAVMGLLEYFVPTEEFGYVFVKYGYIS